MTFGDRELGDLILAGLVADSSARLWVRTTRPGVHQVELCAEGETARFDIDVREGPADHTHAWSVPIDIPGLAPLRPGARHTVRLLRAGAEISSATFRTAPSGRSASPRRWTFGAFSCHQPFAKDGGMQRESDSMLRAAHTALTEADVPFVLMMGDQMYADDPAEFSLYDRHYFREQYFREIHPADRTSLLECSAEEVRAMFQRRYRIFWASERFTRIQRAFACYPMIDDHEIIDNFGTHPAHATPRWRSVREGSLDAAYDYQLSRVLPPRPGGGRPDAFDHGFVWGPAAVWVMDVRSQRRTSGGRTRVFTEAQLDAFSEFLARHAHLPLQVVTVPIPLAFIEGVVADAVGQLLGKGSDVHERWSHSSSVDARDRWVGILLEHARAFPRRRIVLLGGDVHTGSAFTLDFGGGVQMHQLTSSAICNVESRLVAWAAELASKSVDSIALSGGSRATVRLLEGVTRGRDRNPFGRLNIGLVDVTDYGDDVAVGLRLVSHDGKGNPVTVFDSGEIGRRPGEDRRPHVDAEGHIVAQ